jgi:glycosyltransferase involved in cell wall biosynthesis
LNDAKGKHWLMLYAANTGRARWRFWDVILDDLSGFSQFDKVGTGRFFYNFIKPISPEFFFPKELPKKYDICIGASHIHDRKGQWRTIKAIIEYERMYGKKLKCILPGKFMRGVNTNEIKYDVQKNNLDVEITGMVHRDRVAEIMNESKLFVYCGTGGQNDRGPLEALRCGTKIIVANTRRHHPLVYENKEVSTVINHNDFKGIAKEINRNLMAHKKEDRHIVSSYYETVAGMETVVVPRMVELLEVMKRFAHQPKAQHLKEHFLK